MEEKKVETKASPEQIVYADILFYGSWFGIAFMTITYIIYITGILDPYVPLKEMPLYWSKNVHNYVEQARIPVGWGWLALIGKGDFINLIGVAFLALLTIVGFISLIPAYIRKKDFPFAVIATLEILVLVLAASGILKTGGH
ncbi:MAG: DUF1634 domain-containing protein [Thermodesulforhabdaceae bacterium]